MSIYKQTTVFKYFFQNLFLDKAMVATKTCKNFGNQALHAPIEPWPLIQKKKTKKKAILNIYSYSSFDIIKR